MEYAEMQGWGWGLEVPQGAGKLNMVPPFSLVLKDLPSLFPLNVSCAPSATLPFSSGAKPHLSTLTGACVMLACEAVNK